MDGNAIVLCSESHSERSRRHYGSSRSLPGTAYGITTLGSLRIRKSHTLSLWYARNAGGRSKEIKQATKDTDNSFSFMTAMMRITKIATNDFNCAKRSVKPFTTDENDENTKTASDFLTVVYHAHIIINQRLLDLLRNLDSTNQGELMDQISTLQVERGQRWADLVQPCPWRMANPARCSSN